MLCFSMPFYACFTNYYPDNNYRYNNCKAKTMANTMYMIIS